MQGVPPDALAARLAILRPREPGAGGADPVAPLDPGELLARLRLAVAPPTGADETPVLLVVDDGGALVDGCRGGAAAGRALLVALLEGLGAADGGGGGGSTGCRVRTLLLLPGAAGCDVALTPPGPGHAPASLQAALARRAAALLQLFPLPTGFSRDVHGRLWVAPGPAASDADRRSVPCVSVLYRVGEAGRVRLVGQPTPCG